LEQRLAFQELKELLQICDGRVQFVIEPITCVGDVHRASVAFRARARCGSARNCAAPRHAAKIKNTNKNKSNAEPDRSAPGLLAHSRTLAEREAADHPDIF
jgi:hypothetical protein